MLVVIYSCEMINDPPAPTLSECEFTACLTSSVVTDWLAPVAAVSLALLEHSGMIQIMSTKDICGGHP